MNVRLEIRVNGNLELDTYTNVNNIPRLCKDYFKTYRNAVITIRIN